jgi:hypothetical protein
MEAVRSCETSDGFVFTTRRYIPEVVIVTAMGTLNPELLMQGIRRTAHAFVHTQTDSGYSRSCLLHGVTSREIALLLEQCVRRSVRVSLENVAQEMFCNDPVIQLSILATCVPLVYCGRQITRPGKDATVNLRVLTNVSNLATL